MLYITSMWVSGILQGLMWRAYTKLGFLEYSFIETVEAMHPFYVIRALGGALFLVGALMMVFNLWRTVNPAETARAGRPRAGSGGVRRRRKCRSGQNTPFFEKNSIVLVIGILIVIAIGGLVEIAPLFYLKSTIEKVDGVRPYTPLELAGRNIYVREGCYNCHSQMIRPLRDEVERYGHYSLAAESMYDRPFQWGSKRTGPDLARVGGKYSDDWHRDHLRNPHSVVPGSVMPAYPWLEQTDLDSSHIADDLRVQAALGVPYTPEMIAAAQKRPRTQATTDSPDAADLAKRYPKAQVARFRRQSEPHHRSRRADRLSADARHASRLQALRRQSQHPVRPRWTRPIKPSPSSPRPGVSPISSSSSPLVLVYALWPSRKKQFDEAARIPLRED